MIAIFLLACAATPEVITEELPQIPVASAMPVYEPPSPEVSTLANGLDLWVIEDHRLPLVSLRVILPGGSRTDPAEGWGTTYMATEMMEESAGERSTVEMSNAFGLLGADFWVTASREGVVVSLDVLTHRLEEALPLVADALLRPTFDLEDWERVKSLHLDSLDVDREEGDLMASEISRYASYAEGNSMGWPVDGTPEMIGRVRLSDARSAWESWAVPGGAVLVAVGDISTEQLTAMVDTHFPGWEGEPPEAVPDEIQFASPPRLLLLDFPGAQQTAVSVRGPGPSASELAAANVAMTVVGGSFTSRLNQLLREEKGYTYGAGAGIQEFSDHTLLSVWTSVRADATVEAIEDLLGVLAGVDLGFHEVEAEKGRAQILSGVLDGGATRGGLARSLRGPALRGQAPEILLERLKASHDVGTDAMRQSVGHLLDPGGLIVVLAGDRSVIEPALTEAGYVLEVVELLP